MNPGWFLKTRSPSSSIRRNASRPSSERGSMVHLPMVHRRYVTTPPGLLQCFEHHDTRPLGETHLPRWRILAEVYIKATLSSRVRGKSFSTTFPWLDFSHWAARQTAS